jgi:hypothetical protein
MKKVRREIRERDTHTHTHTHTLARMKRRKRGRKESHGSYSHTHIYVHLKKHTHTHTGGGVTLAALREEGEKKGSPLAQMVLLQKSRLSVQPVKEEEWRYIYETMKKGGEKKK